MRSAFRRKGKTRRFVNRFRFILVCFLALGFLCGGSEYLSARLLSAPDGGPREWHLTRPSAYWFSPYWSPKLVEEQYSTTNDIGNDGLPTLRDFHGSYINIDGGIRRTSFQPSNPNRTIYLFGSSTTVNAEVPDGETIASFMQLMVLPKHYRVVNMGVYTVTTFQEAKRLETIALQPNDIVVFYGGITDAISIPQTAYNRRDLEMSTSFPNWLRDHFHFFTVYLLTQPAYKIPEVLTNDKLLDQEVATATSQYQAALLEARHYTEAKGAHFVSALQPQLWSYPLSQEEQKAEAFPGNITFGFRIAVVRSWPAFAKVTDCDLTHSLDWLRALHFPVYFDHAHTNEYGNNLVALSILDCPALVTSIIKQAQLLF